MARGKGRRKEPGVLGKVARALYEDAMRRRAIRILERQAWGLEFLSMALVKAGRHLGEGLALAIENRDGTRIVLTYDDALRSESVKAMDESIFMHLDDELAIERFVRENSRR